MWVFVVVVVIVGWMCVVFVWGFGWCWGVVQVMGQCDLFVGYVDFQYFYFDDVVGFDYVVWVFDVGV